MESTGKKKLTLPLNTKLLQSIKPSNNVNTDIFEIKSESTNLPVFSIPYNPVNIETVNESVNKGVVQNIKIPLKYQLGVKNELELKSQIESKISISDMPKISNITGIPNIRPSVSNVNSNFDKSVPVIYQNRLLEASKKEENELDALRIESSLIRFLSFEELKNISVVKIDKIRDGNDSKDRIGTLDDPLMGPSDSIELCGTCRRNNFHCGGHPGRIELHRPILHPECISYIVKILKCICNDCSELLVSREELEERGILRKSGKVRLDAIVEISEKMHCRRSVEEGVSRCSKNPKFISSKIKDSNKIWYERVESGNNITRFMDVNEVMQKFKALSDSDVETLGFTNGANPINMIIRGIYVISPINRIASFRDGQQFPHSFTVMYTEIIKENNKIGAELKKPAASRNEAIIAESVEKLSFMIKHFINNSDGKYSNPQKHPHEGIKQKIQGKEGVIRGLIMGKRVNFAGRTVMSPDPNLKFGQIRIPKVWASILTRPEKVFSANLERIRNLFKDKKITYITKKEGLGSIKINDLNKNILTVEIGDTVERWLQNGDYLLYNRQPSIQKECMMGYEVVLGDELTIGAHVSICRAHNLDKHFNV
jgi:DNA-directed RNA polymerase II subunit RPB1